LSSVNLFDSLEHQQDVGSRRYRVLQKLALNRIIDAVFFFPRSYEDHSEIKPIAELRDRDEASVVGEICDYELLERGYRKSAFYLHIKQENHVLRGIWFNQPYRAAKVAIGKRVMLSGTVKMSTARPEMMHPKLTFVESDEPPLSGSILPVYRLTEGIKQPEMRRLIRRMVQDHVVQVEEIFTESYRSEKELMGIKEALLQIHLPENRDSIEPARKRFVYQELLTLQLAINLRRLQVAAEEKAPRLSTDSKIDSHIKSYFPFRLTEAQNRVMGEVAKDMNLAVPMNRMLHGDVGCGKTCVAVYALMLAVANGHQGVLMAPTETLARQHFRNLQALLAGTQVKVGILTGTLSSRDKREILGAMKSGDVGIVVGTQALVQNGLEFAKLGLVIVDEQHRFGVRQRAQLRQKEMTPHYLVMTATPIPRTVGMTLFGDLNVSVLDELPPQRQAVNTYLCDSHQKEKWWEFMRKKLQEGRQAYVIAPLVDGDRLVDDDSTTGGNHPCDNVEETFENLVNGEFAEFQCDLVHGRQTSEEKESAMIRFSEGKTQVLVATTVVEVGVDVPNATLMTILSANRFGLAQLHQLRGRVGRGAHAGFVGLFADEDSEDGNRRLEHVVETQDGFELAELDFQLRGPGDLFGTKQHGMPPLFVADLQRDFELLVSARQDAQKILEADPHLNSSDFAILKKRVMNRYGAALDISDVG
jgi:ATP-dependent DNA helicase RecG